jgi:hypothetical protein
MNGDVNVIHGNLCIDKAPFDAHSIGLFDHQIYV